MSSSSPPPPPPPPLSSSSSSMDSYHPPPSPDPGFPIVAVALIGILSTSFLLVSYYVFAVKCGLGGQRVDVVFGRFWIFPRSRRDDPLLVYSPPRVPARGLDDAVILSIPVRNFKSRGDGNGGGFGERSFCECAVCLNEFQEDEKLKVIPTCCHVFHVDCIDVWLQNNANCPLCRRSISGVVLFPFNTASLASRSSPGDYEQSPEPLSGVAISGDEDFVVIEIDRGNGERLQSPESSFHSICITPRDSPTKSENKPGLITGKGGRRRVSRTPKMTSMGDEAIDTRREGEREFPIQPMRRSISMDSGTARGALLQAVQEALSQQRKRREAHEEATDEQTCGTSGGSDRSNNNIKMRRSRSFFSFGHHGRVPRSSAAVQPIAF